VRLECVHAAPGLNRFWFRLRATPGEAIWGCGKQMSYFDLRGRLFPLSTSEPVLTTPPLVRASEVKSSSAALRQPGTPQIVTVE
jgi:hypothetical protein